MPRRRKDKTPEEAAMDAAAAKIMDKAVAATKAFHEDPQVVYRRVMRMLDSQIPNCVGFAIVMIHGRGQPGEEVRVYSNMGTDAPEVLRTAAGHYEKVFVGLGTSGGMPS